MIGERGSRVAMTNADATAERRLRARFGLEPGILATNVPGALSYAGRDFRAYPYMRVGEAARFYAAMQHRWDPVVLSRALHVAGLADAYEIRRMKRAFQRALVLAFGLAASPEVLVVEGAEEFDEPGARALLAHGIASVATVVVTYAADVADAAWFDTVTLARDAFDRVVARA